MLLMINPTKHYNKRINNLGILTMPLSPQETESSLNLIIKTFKELRPELMKYYGAVDHIRKDDNSPVTELDVMVESLIKERLAQACPHIGFHGEETEPTEGTSGATWFIDPIDGTSSFVHGLPYCTNMAGLVVDGETVAAVIYQFVTDDLYTARKGMGAYKNGERIAVKNTALNDTVVFAGPFAYSNLYRIFKDYRLGIYAPMGASGYEYTRLAQGNIQGVMKLHSSSQVHDNVPGVLIAQEAGAEVVSFEGEVYTHDALQFVVGSPNFIEVVNKHKAEVADVMSQLS